ncbi:ankyrin repeat domain-containing protein [Ruegeria intermedia]|uniref:ankyrin repeat domain-containing protein n=1 Tax=Ruegeria intermedia TaxID=996115 RepID=UPI00165F8501
MATLESLSGWGVEHNGSPGRTALHFLALGHSTRCFELILSSGADVMARTCLGTLLKRRNRSYCN